jgi:hypothetical protein
MALGGGGGICKLGWEGARQAVLFAKFQSSVSPFRLHLSSIHTLKVDGNEN